MRALAIADVNPINLQKILEQTRPEIVLLLGDLDEQYLRPLENYRGHVLGVYGNHCDGAYLERLGAYNMHRKTASWRGLVFGGFEGCVQYKPNGWQQYGQAQAERWLRAMPAVDIFLTHCPPEGINDDPADQAHRGWDGLRWYVETHRPKLLLHGHTHLESASVVTQLGQTRIEYVYGHRVIDIP